MSERVNHGQGQFVKFVFNYPKTSFYHLASKETDEKENRNNSEEKVSSLFTSYTERFLTLEWGQLRVANEIDLAAVTVGIENAFSQSRNAGS